MAKTGYVDNEEYLLHDPGSGHVERPDRHRAIHERLVFSGLVQEMTCLEPDEAPLSWIEILHDPEYIARFEGACEKGLPILDIGDCGICKESFGIARLAVAALCRGRRRYGRWWTMPSVRCGLPAIMPNAPRPWASASSITWPWAPVISRKSMAGTDRHCGLGRPPRQRHPAPV